MKDQNNNFLKNGQPMNIFQIKTSSESISNIQEVFFKEFL